MTTSNNSCRCSKHCKTLGFILGLISLVAVAGCSRNGAAEQASCAAEKGTSTHGIDYLLPTPEELISHLGNNNVTLKNEQFIDLQKCCSVTQPSYKAIYFGITYSDFLYLSYFSQSSQALDYLNALKRLSNELGITNRLNNGYFTRMESNLTNVDSLKTISLELSIEVFKNIETMGGKELYTKIGIGTTIEALYLATQSVENIDGNEKLIARIVEMGLFFDHYMENYKQQKDDNEASAELLDDLNAIKDGFYALNEGAKKHEPTRHLPVNKSRQLDPRTNNEKYLGLKRQVELIRENIFEQKY